jgi:hypothetical protein
VVDVVGRVDEFLRPGDRFVVLDEVAEKSRVACDRGRRVEVTLVRGPPKGGAKVGQLDTEPFVRFTRTRAVPQRHDVGFSTSEVVGMGGPNLFCSTGSDEFIFGELANRLQHRKPGSPRAPIGDEQRLADQRVEQIEYGVAIDVIDVIGTRYRAGTSEIESARKHRTPIQQCLLCVIKKRVRPCHRMAQRLVTFQSPPRPDEKFESVIESVTHLTCRHRRHP